MKKSLSLYEQQVNALIPLAETKADRVCQAQAWPTKAMRNHLWDKVFTSEMDRLTRLMDLRIMSHQREEDG